MVKRRKTKQDILDSLTNNHTSLSKAVEIFIELQNEIVNNFSTGEKPTIKDIKVQNIKAIDNNDVNRLKSDAEIKRIPWAVETKSISDEEHDNIVNYMINENKTKNVKQQETIAIKAKPKETFLSGVLGNEMAVKLYNNCKKDISTAIKPDLYNDLKYMINHINIDNYNETLLNMIECILLNHDKPDVSDNKINYILK